MKKTLYLHIGTEKTGSTALQVVSGLNRATLMSHGFFYPKSPGEQNHTKLAIFAADASKTLNLRRLAQLFPDDAYKRFKAQFPEQLRAEVEANPCPVIYLSNEHLSSRIRSAQEVRRLAAIVRPLADTVNIVVYLRPQPELFLSTYSTEIKAGRTKPPDVPKSDQHPRYNYDKLLSVWAEVFGEQQIIVRIYDRATLVEHDAIRDFFSIMHYEPGPDIEIPPDPNARLDQDALSFLLEFNKHVPPFLQDGVNPDRGDVASALESKTKRRPFTVRASVLRDVARIFEESNARVARRYLNRADGKLFRDVHYEDREIEDALTVERAVEISAHLWLWKQRQLQAAKRELTRLKSKSSSLRKPR